MYLYISVASCCTKTSILFWYSIVRLTYLWHIVFIMEYCFHINSSWFLNTAVYNAHFCRRRARKGWFGSAVCWAWASAYLGAFKAEYMEKDETLDTEQTTSIVARPLQYTETGSRIDLGPWSDWGLDYCPLTGHNPGLLLAFLLDVTPWGDIYISWGYATTPYVGNVVLRRKFQSTFCMSVRL